MCQYDRHCENQDRNKECACYAREQTLRAEQYSNVIDELDKRLKKTQENELEVRRENEKLEKQLEIATKVLNLYAREDDWEDCTTDNSIAPVFCIKGCFYSDGYLIAKNALTEIEELEK